jgi:DNA-directed RNA polymerase specialized sigma24 family protein
MLKKDIDNYFKLNIKVLKTLSLKIVRSNKWKSKDPDLDSDELLSFLFIHIYENIDDMKKYTEINFNAFVRMFIHNQWYWSNSDFRRSRRHLHKQIDIVDRLDDITTDSYSYQDTSWEGVSFNAPDNVKLYVTELFDKGLGEESIKKVCAALMSRTLLPYHQQSLFDFYFIDGLTTREISNICKIPTTSVHYMLKDLKEKVKDISYKMINY